MQSKGGKDGKETLITSNSLGLVLISDNHSHISAPHISVEGFRTAIDMVSAPSLLLSQK